MERKYRLKHFDKKIIMSRTPYSSPPLKKKPWILAKEILLNTSEKTHANTYFNVKFKNLYNTCCSSHDYLYV